MALICEEKGLVYLAHPKTASKATRQYLLELPEWEKIPGGHHDNHAPRPGYLTFTVIRNHWDAWVSWYWYSPVQGRGVFNAAWIDRFAEAHPAYLLLAPDRMWALHENADRLLRFERIEQDLADVLQHPVVLPRVNIGAARVASKKRHYSEFYDDETREYVGTRFHREIMEYGYTYS